MQIKKNAVDLTELAIGVLILGIVTAIGAKILITQRDSRLTDLSSETITNETIAHPTTDGVSLINIWCKGVTSCMNLTGTSVSSGNYSTTINNFGVCTLKNLSNEFGGNWKCTYTVYNTTRADWALANSSAIGLAEYGNWFKTIVIVGVAAVVLTLIFMSFGRGSTAGIGTSAGSGEGSY